MPICKNCHPDTGLNAIRQGTYTIYQALIENFYKYLEQKVKLKGSAIANYFGALKKVIGLAQKAHSLARENADTLFA